MLRIGKDQDHELTRRMFRDRVYRFLLAELRAGYRARVGRYDDVAALWASVPWLESATEHDLAVYLTFAWVATFDAEAARRLAPPDEALGSHEGVFAMKSYLADAGVLDICAFDKA